MSDVINNLPTPQVMTSQLRDELRAFASCNWLATTGSTNNDLMALARSMGQQAGWPRLQGSHHQTQGKGRLGRTWLDAPGQTLMFSCGFAIPMGARGAPHLQALSLAIGVVSAQCVQAHVNLADAIRVKWPNDLMLEDGKFGGVLIEVTIKSNIQYVVIGIGLNLGGHAALSTRLDRDVGAIGQIFLAQTSLTRLVAKLATSWHDALGLNASAGFEPFVNDYRKLDYLAQRPINLLQQDTVIASGVASGIAPDGSLQVKTEQGIQTFNVGDVSVRTTSTP